VTVKVTADKELTYNLHYVITPEKLRQAEEWLSQQKLIGLDFETSGLDAFREKVATVQIGTPLGDDPTAFVIDVRCFTQKQLEPILSMLASPKIQKLGQNIKFECRFGLTNFGTVFWNVLDTQVTEMILRAGLLSLAKGSGDAQNDRAAYGSSSMDALCKRYLGIGIDKDKELRTSFYSTPPGQHVSRQLVYAAGDVIYPFFIWMEQQREADARSLQNIITMENKLIPILALAEHRGMGIDLSAWMELWQESMAGRIEAERRIHRALLGGQQHELLPPTGETYHVCYPKTGAALNLDSPTQIKWAITEYCRIHGWPVKIITNNTELKRIKLKYGKEWLKENKSRKKTVDDVPEYLIPEDQYCILISTNAETLRLARLKKQLPNDLVEMLLEYSKYQIRETTFGKEFLNKHLREDGRIHPEFHQALTATGRLSASPNSMNIPQDPRYRAAFKPAEGYSFTIADYSQIEPRLSAQQSGDPVYRETFNQDDDIYLRVAETMLGHRPDKTTEEGNRERQVCKTIVLAMAYRMGPAKLQRRLALALEQDILDEKVEFPDFFKVREMHSGFLSKFDSIHKFQEECSSLANPVESTRTLYDIFMQEPVTWISALCGRKRFFPPTAKNTYTEASNAPIQGCSATITKTAIVLIQNEIRKKGYDAHLVNVVHDELIYECRNDQAEEFAQVMKERMEAAGQYYMADVPVKAEFPKRSNGVVPYWTKEMPANVTMH